MPRRLVLALAAAGIALSALPGHAAAPKPQLTDAKGDAVGMQAGTDIVSVQFSTTGTGKGKFYKPAKLVVTMTLAGPPVTTPPGITYEVDVMTKECGLLTFSMQDGSPYTTVTGVNGWGDWGDCTTSTAADGVELIRTKVKGNTITWSWGLKAIPKALKVGTVWGPFEARVDPTNPVVPFPSSLTSTELGLIDAGSSTATWKLG
jgi:hypothetical protein